MDRPGKFRKTKQGDTIFRKYASAVSLVPPVSHGAFPIKCSKTMIMGLFKPLDTLGN
jgi:hypothetical protein